MSENKVGSLLKYLPLALVFVTVIASGTAAQLQIAANSSEIQKTNDALQLRVPTFLYEFQSEQIEEDITEIAEDVDSHAEAIQRLLRGNDNTNAKLELEIERLRAELEKASAEQAAKLQAIIDLLQQRNGD